MELRPGVVIKDTFRLERELGAGSMGALWVATHVKLGTAVAIKVMRDVAGDEERFEQEARVLAQMRSPHVVRVLDFGTCEAGEPYFAMELLDGHDLKHHIQSVDPMPLAQTQAVVRQVGSALYEAHSAGIIHRDIKPANIFVLDTPGTDLFVKVLDFGVAKRMDAGLGMTATGMMIGTPYYASPEQLLEPRSVDHRTDLWSLAVVAYACLTGALPFLADNLTALALKIKQAVYVAPTQHRADLPPAVDAWMQRALCPDREARFASALELAEALGHALEASSGHVQGAQAVHEEPAPSLPTVNLPRPPELSMQTVALEPPMTTVAMHTASPIAPPRQPIAAPIAARNAEPIAETIAQTVASRPQGLAVPVTAPAPVAAPVAPPPKPESSSPRWPLLAGAVVVLGGVAAAAFTWGGIREIDDGSRADTAPKSSASSTSAQNDREAEPKTQSPPTACAAPATAPSAPTSSVEPAPAKANEAVATPALPLPRPPVVRPAPQKKKKKNPFGGSRH